MKPKTSETISTSNSNKLNKIKKPKPKEGNTAKSVETVKFIAPPINTTAETVEQIYPLDIFLTPEQYEAIYKEMTQKDFQQEFSRQAKDIYSSRELTEKQTVLALYISALYKLIHRFSLQTKRYIPSHSSPTLTKHILENFTTEKKSIPPCYRRKAITYALVLTMLINNYRVKVLEFLEEFGLSDRAMTSFTKLTGATMQPSHTSWVLQLKLPLQPRSVKFKK